MDDRDLEEVLPEDDFDEDAFLEAMAALEDDDLDVEDDNG